MAISTCPSCEPRPRDFSARFARSRQRSVGHRRRRRAIGRSALAMLGAVALPAFAEPQDWDRFTIGDAHAEADAVVPMPFERAGASFPGSAFYYRDAEPVPVALGQGIRSDADIGGPGDASASLPLARALRLDGSGLDRSRAEECLTAAIYYEAASEPDSGQRAVAQVVLNRVAHPSYPGTVCGVVYQGSERRTGCQFSFTCDGSLSRKPDRLFWLRARDVARDALAGYVHAPASLATHYHTVQVHPYWAPSLGYLGTIGAHRFYSFRGAAGRPGTFRFAYAGGEPLPVPHRRDDPAAEAQTALVDPLAIQKIYEAAIPARPEALSPANQPAGQPASPAPLYTAELAERGGDALYRGEKLPDATGIRPEYRNSGRWIAQPGI